MEKLHDMAERTRFRRSYELFPQELSEITLTNPVCISENDLFFMEYCTTLTINLTELCDISFINKLPNLKKLTIIQGELLPICDLGDTSFVESYLFLSDNKTIDELSVYGEPYFITSYIATMDNLRELAISNCLVIADSNEVSKVKKLSLLQYDFTETFSFASFVNAEVVSLNGIQDDMSAISAINCLKELELYRTSIDWISSVSECNQLCKLSIDCKSGDLPTVIDDCTFIYSLNHLKYFCVNKGALTDEQKQEITTNLPNCEIKEK